MQFSAPHFCRLDWTNVLILAILAGAGTIIKHYSPPASGLIFTVGAIFGAFMFYFEFRASLSGRSNALNDSDAEKPT